jgi:hypothetical protein
MTLEAFGQLVAYGIQPMDYWDMTWAEINAVSKTIIEREKLEFKQGALLSHTTARLVCIGISSLFAKHGGKFPTIGEVYPELFGEAPQRDWRSMKAAMMQIAAIHNAEWGRKHGE